MQGHSQTCIFHLFKLPLGIVVIKHRHHFVPVELSSIGVIARHLCISAAKSSNALKLLLILLLIVALVMPRTSQMSLVMHISLKSGHIGSTKELLG